MKRIAIITAGGGGGHNAAAAALAETAILKYPQCTVQVFVIDNYLDTATRAGLISSYNVVVRYLPQFWKFLYKSAGTKTGHSLFSETITVIAHLTAKKLIAAISQFSPDHIIATHFFAPYFLAGTKLEKIPLSVVVTDYGWHIFWYHPNISHYFVASSGIKRALQHDYPIDNEKITVSGIPISPKFYQTIDPIATKNKHHLPPNKPLVLILTGGSGIMDPTKFITGLWKIHHVAIMVITGKNPRMQKKIAGLAWPKKIPHTIIGWTNDMPRYIQAASVIITKPGGLTTTECLTLEKPMVLVSPIPGQEEANIDYLTKLKAARFAASPAAVTREVENYLSSPKILQKKSLTPSNNGQVILSYVLKA